MPSLRVERIGLGRHVGHTVIRHPGHRHDAAPGRLKLNLPRTASHTSDGRRQLAVYPQIGGLEAADRFTEKKAYAVQAAHRAAWWRLDGCQHGRHVVYDPVFMRQGDGRGIHRVGRTGRVSDAVVRIPRQGCLAKVTLREDERPHGVATSKL